MNKVYRIIWNKARKCLMVVAENAKSCGVGSGRKASVVNAVAAVLLSLQGGGAQAQTGYVVDTPTTTPIFLDTAGDSLDVYSSGSIIADTTSAVVAIGNSNVAFISNSGTISSGTDGVYISASTLSGGIYNSGTISAAGTAVKVIGSNVYDAIVNAGSIYGDANGIEINASTVSGDIISVGIINGPLNVDYEEFFAAIRINSSQITGSIENIGFIELTNQGILLTNSSLTGDITNAGTIISGTWAGINSRNSSVTGDIQNTGLISGYTGINLWESTLTGSIQNTGTIFAANSPGISVDESAIDGDIVNAGTIRSVRDVGIYIDSSSISGNITNSGIIDAQIGIKVRGSSTIYGGLTNSGIIRGSEIGIEVRGSSEILGGISNTNSGSIIGSPGQGIVIQGGSSIAGILNDGGYISGISNDGYIGGPNTAIALLDNALISGGIQNSGTIGSSSFGSSSFAGVMLRSNSVLQGGIQNTGSISSISIQSNSQILGGITNSGTIAGTSKIGLNLQSGSTISGGIFNQGSLAGGIFGIGSTNSIIYGGITNQSEIAGGEGGIFFGGVTLTGGINNSGSLSGGGKVGIGLYGSQLTGGLTNSGSIFAYGSGGHGLDLSHSDLAGGIQNTGLIAGAIAGISLYSNTFISGGITNSGSIGAGSVGIGIAAGSTLTGGLRNSGAIIGGTAGLSVRNNSQLNGGIYNSGLIASSGGAGIVLNSTSTISGGLTNSGVIAGLSDSIYVSPNSSLDRIVIAGRNTAVFDGTVYAPNTSVTIAGGSSYIIGTDFIVNGFHNQGILTAEPFFGPSITGDFFPPSVASYNQSADGIYRTSVSGASPGSFGSLYVDGTATFASGSGIDVRLSGLGTGVIAGTSIDGIFVANGGITNSGGFTLTDNSVLLDFTANVSAAISGGNQLNVTAVTSGACSDVVASSTTGPCLVGFDSPYLQVDSGATITSATSGVQVLAGLSDAMGSPNALDMEGVIRGAQYGVQFLSGSTLFGSIQNDGIISGGSAGVILNSATLLGGITNNLGASISGGSGRGIVIDAYSSVDFIANDRGFIGGIHNAGSIGSIANYGNTISSSGGTIAGGIFNAGTIGSYSSGGIFNENFATITGGIVNRGFIAGSGNGISIYGNSLVQQGITNSGTISTSYIGSSRSAIAGISINVNSYVTGGIINSGLIETNDQGILVANSTVYGGIFNAGTILAGGTAGIKVKDSYLTSGIINSGSIAGSNGIQIRYSELTSGIINSGTIIGLNGSGISIQNSNISSGIENTSFISATDAGVKLSGGHVSSGFTNSGTISAMDIGMNILGEGGLSGGLRNSGSIGGSVAGLAISSSSYIYGGLTNSGVIQGSTIGLRLHSDVSIEDGITNSGLISGGSTGIKLSSYTQIYGGLTNSGVISGSNYSVNVSSNSYLSRIIISGRNTAKFDGEVYAPNTTVSISGGSSFLLGSNFVVQSFSNEGILAVDGARSSSRSITGDGSSSSYFQSSSGIYRTNVNYLPMNDYGSMYVDGTATFASGSGIDVRLSGPGTGVTVGTSISGILFSADGITNSGTFSVTDNSVLLDFNANINGNELDVIAVSSDACAGTVSSNTSGPCLVGFDSPSLQVNSGVTISSTTSGVQVLAGYSNNYFTDFGVNNLGSIIGTEYGVQMLSGSTLVGGITNSGNIVGGNAGIILISATLLGGIHNNVGASISGGVGRGIVIDAYSSVAGITNNGGYIGGIANAGNIIVTQNAIVVINEGTNAGENIGFIGGDLQNTGTIIGEQGIGIFLQSTSLAGSIQNSGLIAGASAGIGVDASSITGGITNSGTISSSLDNFYNAALAITNSSISGGIANSGQINASANAIIMLATQVDGGISNSGIINGAGKVGTAFLYSTVSGGINNSGSIIGNGEHGIVISGSLIANGVTNSGKIAGAGHGLNVLAYADIDSGGFDYSDNASISGGLFNSGTIVGSSAAGINLVGDYATSAAYSTTAVALISGGLTNSGLILGASTGIRLSTYATITGGLTNSGVITGDNYSIYVSPNSSLDRIIISGRNTAVFNGEVYAPNTAVTIVGGSTYTLGANYRVNSFSNEGIMVLNAPNFGLNYAISGGGALDSFTQSSSGVLRTNVSSANNFGSLYVDGGIILDPGSTIDVRLSGFGTGVTAGSMLSGVLTAYDGIVSSGFNVTDNSVLLNFNPNIIGGGQLNLTAAPSGACAGTVSANTTGPCLVGFDSPSLLVNSGVSISGAPVGVQVLPGYSNDAIAGFGIKNQQGAIVGTQYGIQMLSGSTLSGGITNSGGIIGGDAGIILNGATLLGGLKNAGDATIAGSLGRGIVIDAYSSVAGIINSGANIGGIQNAGNIITNNNAINVSNAGMIDGGITNSGTIIGLLGAGIYLNSESSIISGIQNSGLINGAYAAIGMYAGSITGDIRNSGTISAQINQMGVGAIVLGASTVSGDVYNTGLIESPNIGLLVVSSQLNGSISNSGLINGAGKVGVALSYGSSMSGSILNVGTIRGNSTGIQIDQSEVSGGISNSGLIQSGEKGILVQAYAYINSSTQVYIGNSLVSGGIVNSGTIIGGIDGIYIQGQQTTSNSIVAIAISTVTGGILNSGSIAARDTGIEISSNSLVFGGITNSGTITAGSTAIRIHESQIWGGITNSGYLRGEETGLQIYGTTIHGSIINSGSIYGETEGAIYIGSSSVIGGINNSGLISGYSGVAIWSSTIEGGITNTGSIMGAGKVGLSLSASLFTGGLTNSGDIGGDASVAVKLEGSTLVGGIHNSGVMNGSSIGLAINGLAYVNTYSSYTHSVDSVVYGGITNSGSIIGVDVAGISLSSVSTTSGTLSAYASALVDGAIINSGLIAGNVGVSVHSSMISGGITNSGLIAGLGGVAIAVTGSSLTLEVQNQTAGTIVGAVNGPVNLINDGLFALQTLSGVGGTIVGGSVVHSTIAGNYMQGSSGSLQIGVNGIDGSGTTSGSYSTLSVSGAAVISGIIQVSMSRNDSVFAGGNLSGILSADSGLTLGSLSVEDNSTLISFNYEQLGSSLNLVAFADNTGCTTVSSSILGPCQIGIDNPGIVVTNLGAITGADVGIEALSGLIEGNIQNAGLVAGSQYGIKLLSNAILAGGITNSGTISGGDTGIKLAAAQVSGSIINSGSIYGGENGIFIASGSTVTGGIFNSGVINAPFDGFEIPYLGAINIADSFVMGGITNAGLIELTNQGIVLHDSTVAGGINNSGTIISGTYAGISLNASSLSGGILNSGSIYGWTGIFISESSVSGGITNTGTIVAFSAPGINLENSTIHDGINNSGLINGVDDFGLSLNRAIVDGGMKNSGSISGQGTGINISSSSQLTGGLTNSGVISGSDNSILVSVGSLLDRIVIEGRNTAVFNGQVNARHTPVTIVGDAAYQLSANFIVDGFSNEGVLAVNPAGPGSSYSITGTGGVVPNYTQSQNGIYRVNVAGITSGEYGSMGVSGSASFDPGSTIDIRLSGANTSVSGGTTLTGVLIADGGITLGGALNVTDNSVFLDFSGSVSGGNQFNVFASSVSACAGTVSVDTTGPCLVGFDSPSLKVNAGVAITSATMGVKVLAGISDGASVSGFGIHNQGEIIGADYGIQLLSGSTLTGGLTNSGVISGGSSGAGVYIYDAALYGGIQNTGSINSVILEYSTLTGGIVNSAFINGAGKIGSGVGLFASNLSGGIFNSGQIDAPYAGMEIYNSTVSGGITNSGTIFAEYGIRASSSNIAGGIFNTGLIDGNNKGLAVYLSTVVGNVMNSGAINGAGKVGLQVIGSNLQNGLTNTGSISGPSSGVFVAFSTIGGGLLNSGRIRADIGGASSTYGGAGISISNSLVSGGVTNSGYISATQYGVYLTNSTVNGGIANSGTIASLMTSSIRIDSSQINGSVLNTDKISGTKGIRIDSSTIIGAVNNSGSIYSNASSFYITESVITEGIGNSGFMQGSYPGGIYIESSTISGGIANSGIITTTFDGYTESAYASLQIYDSSISGGITNSGTITAAMDGIFVTSSTVVGGITNLGLIRSAEHEGIFVAHSEADSINNSGSISANTGIRIIYSSISGVIENSGTITANSAGILVSDSNVLGGIYNYGSIQTGFAGIVLSNANIAGRFSNAGTISAVDTGVLVIGSTIVEFQNSGAINGAGKVGLASAFSTVTGSIQNQAGATISGATIGIKVLYSELLGGLVNSGFVSSGGMGVGIELAYSTISGELRNEAGASIDGGQVGIAIGGSRISEGITNTGIIQGHSIAGIAVFDSFIGRGIFNQSGGTIAGPLGSGILISSGSLVEGVINDGAYIAGISNSGTLVGAPFAISVANGGTIEGGINNSGVIYAGSNGVNIASNSRVSGGITNSGFISGSNYSIYVAPDSSLDRLLITGYESAAFEGEVNVRNTPVTVAGGASFNLSDHFTVNSFSNEGILTVDLGFTKTISGSNSAGVAVHAPYYQAANAIYRVGVQGTSPSDYGSMSVYGSASFAAGSGVDVRISGTSAGLIAGSTIANILFADAGVTNSGTFAVTDNSVYLNFAAVLSGGNTQIDLVATSATGVCVGTVSVDVTGPCLVGFDSPSLTINSGATITSATSGVQVLGGYSDGVSVSGFGIQNHGAITGNNYGVQFQSGAYLTGGLTNTGVINGVNAGIIFNHASLSGDIHNSGTIVGGVGVRLDSSNLSNSITNSGLIAGLNGVAVSVSGFSTAINIQNESTGTIVGAINGTANLNNAGLFALQSISGVGGTIVGGSVVSSSLSGTYIQDGGGTLRIGVNGSSGSGTIAGNYSTLSVDGSATLSGIINVSMNADDAVLVGGTLAGVLYASSGFQLLSPLAVTDNSALVDFEYTITGDSNALLDLVAISSVSGCGTVTSSIGGPCQVAFDAPNIEVTNLGTISGAAKGIQVLSGQINGRILNAGLVSGTQYGVSFNPGATLAGGITNTGTIEGGSAGILINRSTIVGAIVNTGSIAGGNWGIATAYSQLDNGVTNSGTINALYGVRYSFSTVTGSLTNSGLISSGNKGVLINDSFVNGSINNSGTIVGIDSGILIGASTITGGIQNSGALSGITGAGVSLQIDSVISSGFINTGTISGNEGVVLVGGNLGGGVTNAGFISGSVSGISLSAYASVYSDSSGNYFSSSRNTSINGGVVNQGTITATSGAAIIIKGAFASSGAVTAVGFADVTGGLTNSGRIAGQSAIAVSRANLAGGITNTGSLVGSQAAISVTNAGLINGSITNSGLISGNNAITVAASTITGSLDNSGTIAGTVSGITLNTSTIAGAINNSGLIAGGGNAAIAVAASAISGGLNNSGVISGFAGPAIQISGSSPTVEIQNTGTIIGAINGAANLSNAGLFALQSVSGVGGTIVGGSVAHSTIAGNFTQGANGTLQVGVNGSAGSGTLSGNYSTLTVGGVADLAGTVNVNMSAADAVTLGGTLTGVINSASGITVSGLSITDNSALIGFEYSATSSALNLVAVQEVSFANAVEQNNNPAAVPAANILQSLSTNTPVAMQGVINKLYSLPTTLAVSNAISQTLPAMVGAASQASAQSQQNFNQIMQGRQNQLRGLSSGEEYIGSKDVWFKGFGSWANQDAVNNVSGYKVNTGGVAIGIDKDLSPRSNIGAVFAFGNSGMSSSNSAAASGVTINSYQLGVYGDTYVRPDVQVNYQIDGAFNNNKAYRNLSAFNGVPGVATSSKGVNANGSYNSTSAHIGSGVKKFLYLSEDTTFIPSVRADYTSVQSRGYTETGAGSLNMTVNSQTYNMLVTSADLRLDHQFTDKFRASVNVGAGYNILNNQVQVTSAYQGGGAAFTTKGLQVSPWQYNAGLGLTGRIQKDVEVNVRYDTQFTTTGYSNQMVSGKVKFFF